MRGSRVAHVPVLLGWLWAHFLGWLCERWRQGRWSLGNMWTSPWWLGVAVSAENSESTAGASISPGAPVCSWASRQIPHNRNGAPGPLKRLPPSCHCSEWSTTCSRDISAPSLTPVSLTSATQRPSEAPVVPSRPQTLPLLSVHPAPSHHLFFPRLSWWTFYNFLLIKNILLKYSWFTMCVYFFCIAKWWLHIHTDRILNIVPCAI